MENVTTAHYVENAIIAFAVLRLFDVDCFFPEQETIYAVFLSSRSFS